jgi:hypothetical protein
VNILRKLYENTTASIKGMQSEFDVHVGCRQGGQESPVLFNWYFDFVLKIAANAIDVAFPDGWGIAITTTFHTPVPIETKLHKAGCQEQILSTGSSMQTIWSSSATQSRKQKSSSQ